MVYVKLVVSYNTYDIAMDVLELCRYDLHEVLEHVVRGFGLKYKGQIQIYT